MIAFPPRDLPLLDSVITTPVFGKRGALIIEPGYSQDVGYNRSFEPTWFAVGRFDGEWDHLTSADAPTYSGTTCAGSSWTRGSRPTCSPPRAVRKVVAKIVAQIRGDPVLSGKPSLKFCHKFAEIRSLNRLV